MITHYGLFWSERDVHWAGARGNPGQLLGRERKPLGRRGAPTIAERKTVKNYNSYVGIYCLYGSGDLLYIGEAGLGTKSSLFGRLKEHRKGPMSGRWDSFSWFGREGIGKDTSASALTAMQQLEAVTIAIINPGFNRQSGTFSGATQVFQVPHSDAEGDIETKLERLAKQIRDALPESKP